MTFQEGDMVRICKQLSIDETAAFSQRNGRRPLYLHEVAVVVEVVDANCIGVSTEEDSEHFDVKPGWIEKVQDGSQ